MGGGNLSRFSSLVRGFEVEINAAKYWLLPTMPVLLFLVYGSRFLASELVLLKSCCKRCYSLGRASSLLSQIQYKTGSLLWPPSAFHQTPQFVRCPPPSSVSSMECPTFVIISLARCQVLFFLHSGCWLGWPKQPWPSALPPGPIVPAIALHGGHDDVLVFGFFFGCHKSVDYFDNELLKALEVQSRV